MSADAPIFIIGCPRSGTTLLRLMLDSHPHLSCGGETHFLADIEELTTRQWRRIGNYYSKEEWYRQVAAMFDTFKRTHAARQGKRRWADKTPRYTLYTSFIDALFPTCQFIHILRDGHDVVASHRDRWGYWSAFKSAARKWKEHVQVARAFGRTLAPSRYYEIRYEALVRDPEATLRGVLDFLGEPWDPAVLNYEEYRHDAQQNQLKLAHRRRGESGETAPIYTSRVGAGRARLDPLLRAALHLSSRRLLRELGY